MVGLSGSISDDAFWIDGEWVVWDDFPHDDEADFEASHLARLEYEAELRLMFPAGEIVLTQIFKDLLRLAESYFRNTGLHLQIYGDLGEIFGAIKYGIKLHKNYAMGSDGRLGDDFVEIKTITPFKNKDVVEVRLDRHFSKILVVKIDQDFRVAGRMINRSSLPRNGRHFVRLDWNDLEGN